jgi:hypothetical protein
MHFFLLKGSIPDFGPHKIVQRNTAFYLYCGDTFFSENDSWIIPDVQFICNEAEDLHSPVPVIFQQAPAGQMVGRQ